MGDVVQMKHDDCKPATADEAFEAALEFVSRAMVCLNRSQELLADAQEMTGNPHPARASVIHAKQDVEDAFTLLKK